MEKMSIIEYLALEEHVTTGLRKQLKNCFFMDYGREATVEENEDNTITCTLIKSKRYHYVTRLENKELIILKISKETGEILNHMESFETKKIDDVTLENTPTSLRPKK